MDKIKNFIFKYKVIITIIVLLIISFFVYLFVSAEEDVLQNKIEISGASITSVRTGTGEDFDSNDEPGNDSSADNSIVRTFDEVEYNVRFNLNYKNENLTDVENGNLPATFSERNINVDILVNKNIILKATKDGVAISTPTEVNINETKYNYYKLTYNNISNGENEVQFYLNNIYTQTDTEFTPIIQISEETDNNKKQIVDGMDLSSLNNVGNVNAIKISGKENYAVRLYPGHRTDSNGQQATYPFGIETYIPINGNKGIKGSIIPSEINMNLSIQSDNSNVNLSSNNDDYKIDVYTANSSIKIPELPELESSNITLNIGNYNLNQTIDNGKKSDLSLKISNITISNLSNNIISSNLFTFKSSRTSSDNYNVNYIIKTDVDNQNITIEDTYEKYVGKYESKIEFFEQSDSSFLNPLAINNSIFNANEDFYIQNTINYVSGDKLNNITQYIKIDNNAMKIIKIDEQPYTYSTNDSQNTYTVSAQYAVGSWNVNNFRLNSNISGCPTTVDRESLMDLFGGPCVTALDNTINWLDQDAYDNLSDEQRNNLSIMAIKFDISSDGIEAGRVINLRFAAKALSGVEYANIGNSFKVVSRGVTNWNASLFYLSEIPRVSQPNISYEKAIYDINTNQITGNVTKINGNIYKNNGNTILISAVKSSINSVKSYDINGRESKSEKEKFYLGMTDPIELEISPSVKSILSINDVKISVYLPETLELFLEQGDKEYSSSTTEVINGKNYNKYVYTYSSEDIASSSVGTIPNLKIHAYIDITTPDNTYENIITEISSTVIDYEKKISFGDITPIVERQNTKTVILKNIKPINTVGKTDLNNIDINGTYKYTMKTANNSGSLAKLSLLYILPYNGDGIGKGSNYTGTLLTSLENLPSGYKAYYTKTNSNTILTNELNAKSNDWKEWTDYTKNISDITAIKIESQVDIPTANYFGTEDGITVNITTKSNKEANTYQNIFYIIQKDASICSNRDENDNCTETETKIQSNASSSSTVSVYNRTVSGNVFEDSNYNSIYDEGDSRLKDMPVELFKLSSTNFDPKKPALSVSSNDIKIKDSVTDSEGHYNFSGIPQGNYYVKYSFNCEKYTVVDKNKQSASTDTSSIDSDAQMITEVSDDKCYAVSNIVSLSNTNIRETNIDLGLVVRKVFDININKYITNVTVTSNGDTKSYDYNNEKKVKIDLKNLKNASLRVTYAIEIENSKYFPGMIGSLTETIPNGMTYDPNILENDGWQMYNGLLYYTKLNNVLLMPEEKHYLKIVLDLKPENGGNYINIVSANDLRIQAVEYDENSQEEVQSNE